MIVILLLFHCPREVGGFAKPGVTLVPGIYLFEIDFSNSVVITF